MYHKSPMENYNKNNPFIIIAKKTYDLIVDRVHAFSKECLKMFIINAILSVIAITLAILYIIFSKCYFLSIVIGLIVSLNVMSYFRFKRTVRYFMVEHPSIVEFSRLSELEVNNILSLNNEDLLNCIHGLHMIRGELTCTRAYYFYSGSTHYASLVSITMILCAVFQCLYSLL